MAVDCKLEAKFGHRPGVRLKRPRFKRGGEIYTLRPQSITIAAGMRGNGGIRTHNEKLCYEPINYAVRIEGRSTFLATRNATIAVAKWGVTREFFLATRNATFVALQVARKIASCNMALRMRRNN